MSGTPARFQSTSETSVGTSGNGVSWRSLPASSSRWIRTRRIAFSPEGVSIVIAPPVENGRSYCEIW